MTKEHPDTGRTPWDFATELLRTIGRLGPSAVVVTGFLIFAYFFYQEVNKARVETDAQLQAQVKAAQEQLVDTYEKIAGMSDQLITNVSNLIQLNATVDTEIESNREKLAELERESRTTLENAQQLLKDEQNNLATVSLTHIIFGRIRDDIDKIVDGTYLPYMTRKLVRSDFEGFKRGNPNSLFSFFDQAIEEPNDPDIQNTVIHAMNVFLQIVHTEVEAYRSARLAPIRALERSAELDEATLEKLQMTEKSVAEMVDRIREIDTRNYSSTELERAMKEYTDELDLLTR